MRAFSRKRNAYLQNHLKKEYAEKHEKAQIGVGRSKWKEIPFLQQTGRFSCPLPQKVIALQKQWRQNGALSQENKNSKKAWNHFRMKHAVIPVLLTYLTVRRDTVI